METLEVKIKKFLSVGYGYGYGYGDGDGDGYGYGYGDGYGYGYGDGDGYGYGYGDGDGYGYGYGDGDGYGNGNGNGIKIFNGHRVYMIDGVQTLIYAVHGSYAKGAIIQDDCTLQDTYVAKVGDYFAHGKILHKAREDAFCKYTQEMSEDERIEAFIEAHPDKEAKYTYDDLFRWHNYLTGSCEQGRLQFCKERGITPQDKFTIKEFCEITKNAYGGSVISQLLARL